MQVFIDSHPEQEDAFVVSWHTIAGRKQRILDSRDAAESFAYSKMGKRGSVVSTLDMTAEQLAAHRERESRAARGDSACEGCGSK